MLSTQNTKPNAQCMRKKFNGSAKAPETREDIELQEDLIKLKNGKSLLLHDSGPQVKGSYLVFNTQ